MGTGLCVWARGGCPSGSPRGTLHSRQQLGGATLDCNNAMTEACKETRAKCGSRQPEGFSSALPGCKMDQHVPRQGWGGIGTHLGHLAQKGPKISHHSYQNPSGIFLLGTESLQTRSCTETLTGLSWRQLFFGCRAAHRLGIALPAGAQEACQI